MRLIPIFLVYQISAYFEKKSFRLDLWLFFPIFGVIPDTDAIASKEKITMDTSLTLKVTPNSIQRQIVADYSDGDIIIIDDIKRIPIDAPLHIDMILLVICTQGRAHVCINGKPHALDSDEMLICPPNVYIEDYLISPDFGCKIIGLSYPALQRMLHVNKQIWEMTLAVTESPVLKIDDQSRLLMTNYYALLQFKLRHPDSPYRAETIRALFQSIFYDLCGLVLSRCTAGCTNPATRHGDVLMRRFLHLLADAQGRKRSVTYFAEKLCVTPKYLSAVCKRATGRSAKEWIHQYTVEIMQQQLRYTDRSIKEICNLLEFPNLSVFGKFARSALGMSPTAYRTRMTTD